MDGRTSSRQQGTWNRWHDALSRYATDVHRRGGHGPRFPRHPSDWRAFAETETAADLVAAPATGGESRAVGVRIGHGVLVAFVIAGTGLAAILYSSLLAGIDDAAAGRVRDVVAALQFDPVTELDPSLLATDQRIVAVQVIDPFGTVIQHSQSAPDTPLIGGAGTIGATLQIGLPDHASATGDMRISGQIVDSGTSSGYTILVGAGSEAVESTVKTVLLLLAGAAPPLVTAVAAAVSFLLVRRSLRSVDEIRARVAEISASDLAERVPVSNNVDEISALAITMNEMLARIESGHEAQRRFVGDASHELRSPVAAMISALDVAAIHPPELLNEELAASTLRPEAHRMKALVEDLLLLARADERGLTLRRKDVDLDDIASDEMGRSLRESGIMIDAELVPTRLVGDPGGLSRVLRNLLENAERHATSLIELRVRPDGPNAVVTVGDDGPGIPQADRTRVFDRFVRLDPPTAPAPAVVRASGWRSCPKSLPHMEVSSRSGTGPAAEHW